MKSSKLIFTLGMLVLVLSAQAQKRYELTVKEAVDLAFKNVIELKNARLDYRIQEAKNREIIGQALPQVAGNVQANHYLKLPTVLFPQSQQGIYDVLIAQNLIPTGTKAPAPTVSAFSFQQPWNISAGATLTQLLFQPDVFVGLQARQTALDYSTALIEQSEDKIKDTAYRRYYAILIAEKQLYFLNENVKRLEKLSSDIAEIFKNGFAERLDVDKVEVQLNNLRTTRSVVQNAVSLSYAAMKFSLGISQKDTVVLKEDLTVGELKTGILDESFRYEDRAEIRTVQQLKRLQSLDVKRNQLSYLPTASLQGNYTANGMGQKFFTDGSTYWFKSAFVGVNINVPIFTGFQRKYKIQQSQLTLDKVNNSLDLVKQGIDFEQVVSKESLKNALLDLDIQERNQALAERVYNSTKIKFEQGFGQGSQEILLADSEFQQAQANYFNALYQATIAKIAYLHSLGKLK